MTTDWDAVVVGAGPAGSVAALTAARRGLRVLLVDRATFPRPKVCGGCLNGRALDALAAAGLGGLPARLGAVPLRRVTVSAGGRSATLRLPAGASVSREALDAALVAEAVAAGVAFRAGVSAKLGPIREGWCAVELDPGHMTSRSGGRQPPESLAPQGADAPRSGKNGYSSPASVTTRVVIAADGLNGRLTDPAPVVRPASRIGAGVLLDAAPDWIDPGTIDMAVGRGGYVGLVRVEGGRLDVAAALDAGFVRDAGGPGPAAASILRASGRPAIPGLADVRWKGTPPLTRRPRRVAGGRWFAVGDAAGYVEPFTGEGMAWAISSAVAVAPLMEAAARRWDDALAAAWTRAHARLVRRRQWVCRLVAAGLRSPTVARAAVRILSAAPALAAPVVRGLNRPAPLGRFA